MMKIEKQEFINIHMSKHEAHKLVNLLSQITHGSSTAPDWAKDDAEEFRNKLEKIVEG